MRILVHLAPAPSTHSPLTGKEQYGRYPFVVGFGINQEAEGKSYVLSRWDEMGRIELMLSIGGGVISVQWRLAKAMV